MIVLRWINPAILKVKEAQHLINDESATESMFGYF